jgi:hypothetical protein
MNLAQHTALPPPAIARQITRSFHRVDVHRRMDFEAKYDSARVKYMFYGEPGEYYTTPGGSLDRRYGFVVSQGMLQFVNPTSGESLFMALSRGGHVSPIPPDEIEGVSHVFFASANSATNSKLA